MTDDLEPRQAARDVDPCEAADAVLVGIRALAEHGLTAYDPPEGRLRTALVMIRAMVGVAVGDADDTPLATDS